LGRAPVDRPGGTDVDERRGPTVADRLLRTRPAFRRGAGRPHLYEPSPEPSRRVAVALAGDAS